MSIIHRVRARGAAVRALFCIVVLAATMAAAPAQSAQTAQSAQAGKARTPGLSATLPAGWGWSAEGGMTAFYSPGGVHTLALLTARYEAPDVLALLRKYAPDTPIYDLGGGRGYVYESQTGARVWAMLTREGLFCEVTVKNRFDGAGALLASLTANNAQLRPVLEALHAHEVTDWLTFATPRLPAPSFALSAPVAPDASKEKSPVQPFSGYGLRAALPDSWTVNHHNGVTVFAAPGGGQEVSAQLFTPPSARADACVPLGKAQARKIGARNIREEGGQVEFTLPDGENGVFSRQGKRCLMVVRYGESVTLHVVAQSIEPE